MDVSAVARIPPADQTSHTLCGMVCGAASYVLAWIGAAEPGFAANLSALASLLTSIATCGFMACAASRQVMAWLERRDKLAATKAPDPRDWTPPYTSR